MPVYWGECPVCGEMSYRRVTSFESHGLPGFYREELTDEEGCIEGCDVPEDAHIEMKEEIDADSIF